MGWARTEEFSPRKWPMIQDVSKIFFANKPFGAITGQ
jgi:hypothetical protein